MCLPAKAGVYKLPQSLGNGSWHYLKKRILLLCIRDKRLKISCAFK